MALAQILLSSAAMTMAAAIWYHFNFGLREYMEPLKDACGLNGPPKGDAPPHLKLGFGFLDGLHCLLTPFFLDCVALPAGRFFVIKTLELAAAVMALMAVEDCRTSARGFVRGSILVLIASQIVGVSVAVPFLWLPCFLLFARRHVEGAFLPAGKMPGVAVASALAALLTAPLAAASLLPDDARLRVVVNFNLLLPALPLLWMLSPGGRAPGNAAAASALRAAAAVAFVMHVAAFADLALSHNLDGTAAARAVAAVASRASPDLFPANFMLFDFLGLLGAAAIFAISEFGSSEVVGMAAKAVIIGPGAAFALACAAREERLAASAAAAPPPPAEGEKPWGWKPRVAPPKRD
ncbi:MAG: hypothetical protein J3K34DRAFT_398720 [Monoraphidium minutum]|nr:MAG: hypothetical protein J3K34DRAFT_398720 [Monoraphidium minutum]